MPTILCIDDDTENLAVRRLLLEACGYRVLAADNPNTGLEIADREGIDLAIVDYRMPQMSGLAVATVLKSRRPNLPVILLSGYLDEVSEDLRSLVDTAIRKGGQTEALIDAVKRLIGPAAKVA